MTSTIALFDLDGTLSSGRIWEGFLKYYLVHKHKKRTAWILAFWAEHLPLWWLKKCKLISEEKLRSKWIEDLCGVFKEVSREEVLQFFRWVSDNYVFTSLRSDIVDILNQHKQSGRMIVIVSAAFNELLEIVGQELGIATVIGTKLEVIDGTYTGKIIKPACFGRNKVKLVEEFISQNGLEIDLASSFAYADSFSDIPLLKLVGNPVATYPDRALRQFAQDNNWQILS
jgi:HAD superfamily hydrolase (TIGR01490 family)